MRRPVLLVLLALVLVVALIPAPCVSAEEDDWPTPSVAASYSFDAIANATAATETVTTTSSAITATSASQAQSSPPEPEHANCEWGGVTLRHGRAKYLVGRAHRRGSIYGECLDGEVQCYEDAGLADAQRTHDRAVACALPTLAQRQRDFDREDAGDATQPSPPE